MKKVLLSLGLLVSSISFAQVTCCNVVDGAGLTVVDTNGACITAPNLPSYTGNCGLKTMVKEVPVTKMELKASEKAILAQALEGVKFKTNSDVLLPESLPKIDNVAELMKSNSAFHLTIDGYTDNTGNADHNKELSYKRAEAAKARLIEDGISASRITTHGYGIENPVATNDTAEGRAKNRRVEFLISF